MPLVLLQVHVLLALSHPEKSLPGLHKYSLPQKSLRRFLIPSLQNSLDQRRPILPNKDVRLKPSGSQRLVKYKLVSEGYPFSSSPRMASLTHFQSSLEREPISPFLYKLSSLFDCSSLSSTLCNAVESSSTAYREKLPPLRKKHSRREPRRIPT